MLYRTPTAVRTAGFILLNMVDTPGYPDFGSKLIQSLMSIQGGILLFGAVQGVQAQTIPVYEKLRGVSIRIILAQTKFDLPMARPLNIALVISDMFGFVPDTVLHTSSQSMMEVDIMMHSAFKKVSPTSKLLDYDGVIFQAKLVET